MTMPTVLTRDSIHEMMDTMQACFRAQSAYILARAGKSSFTDKHDGSPVTLADSKVEQAIIAQFHSVFPEIALFGEESGYEKKLPETCWLIDPIDGTANFIANIPTFTCMAVLLHQQTAVACVIFNPTTNEMFTAYKGEGAYKNGEQLNLTTQPLAKIAYSKGRHIEELDRLLHSFDIHTEIAPNGAGFGFCAVASGDVAVRFQLHSKGGVHDYAPGALLVEEAGGSIIPIASDVYRYDTKSFVACHPSLSKFLQEAQGKLRELEK